MSEIFSKWVSFYGNAVSIAENRPESYSKNITLRYPIYCPFDGNKIRLTFDNYCGLESITITRATVLHRGIFYDVKFDGKECVEIAAKKNRVSDEVDININRGDSIEVSFYFEDYTSMRSAVYVQGPLSGGKYSIGDNTHINEWDINIEKRTNIYYFLSNISIYTEENNHAIVCYGDSITAQDWPDYLALKLKEAEIYNYSIIRRATSGSRILREYSCITYESYGLKGTNRFTHEVPTDGAEILIIQQGINDIIHPVGVEVNPYRPMSDLPSVEELCEGLNYYINKGKEYGLKVVLGTLIPIEGWRTYADFRENMKNDFNEYIRLAKVDGVIDFDKAIRDVNNPKSFALGYDSGDHLHPSSKGYKKMAQEAFEYLIEYLNGRN